MKNVLQYPSGTGKKFPVCILLVLFLFSFGPLRAQCPLSPPTLGTPPSFAATCNSLQISYLPVSGAISYQVEYSTNLSFTPSFTQNVTNTPIITGLNSGTEYFYRIRSYNTTCGFSAPSTWQNNITDGPPVLTSITDLTCTTAKIYYHANARLVTGHTITETGGLIAPIYKPGGGSFLNEYFTGLTPNTTYTFTITEYTNTTPACTLTSAPIIITTPIPATPAVQSANPVFCSEFTANWTMISGVDGYYLDVATDALFTSYVPGYNGLYILGAANNSLSIPFLNPSSTYYYRVSSTKGSCTSLLSGTQTVTTDDLITPSIVTVSNITCSGADVNWTSSPGATGYDMTIRELATGNVVANSNTPAMINLTGLSPGTTYEYTATTFKSPDCNNTTVNTFTTDPLPDPPLPPSSFIQQSCSTATINWNTVSGATDYLLEVSLSPSFTPLIHSATSTTPYQNVSGLTTNVTYYYRIATIAHHTCVGSYSSAETMLLEPPLPPSGINVSNVLCFSADLDWTSLTGTDLVQVSEDMSFSTFVYNQSVNGGAVNLTNIQPGTTYYYRIASVELPNCTGHFSSAGLFNTSPSISDFMPVSLPQTGTYYETCAPITEPIGGTSDCVNRWYVEVQYFTDPLFSFRPFASDPSYEWTSPVFTGAVPAQFDAGGFSNFVTNNGGSVYPANMIFEPNSYYRIVLITGYDHNGSISWINMDNIDLHICHFTVNGDASDGPVQVCYGDPIFAQASATAASFVMAIEEFDPSGNPTGLPITNLISPTDMLNGFDIRTVFFGPSFAPGYTYTISLSSGLTYYSTKTIQIKPVVSSFTINGVQTSPLVLCNAPSVILDGSASSCTSGIYFLRYAECDASGTPLTPWSSGSVGPNVSNIDLVAFAASRAPFVAGKYYKISFGVGSSMVYSEQIIQISASPASANAGADQTSYGNTLTLTGNTPTIETVQWSIISGNGGSFSNANLPSTSFTPLAGEIYTIRYTLSTPCGSTSDDMIVYADAIFYVSPNAAYRTEACNGHRKVYINGNSYTWDAVNQQYTRQNSSGSTLVIIPTFYTSTFYEIDRNTFPGMGSATHAANPRTPAFGWDNETLNNRPGISLPSAYNYSNNEHIWDQDHLFVGTFPIIFPDLAALLGTSSGINIYNIGSPFYTPNATTPFIPGSGTYDQTNRTGIIDPGNIDLDASSDYLMQQDAYNNICASYYGPGWRLASKTEMGVTESVSNSQLITLDEAYVGTPQINFITSSMDGNATPYVWCFAPTGLVNGSNKPLFNAFWENPVTNIISFKALCVFKSNPACGGYYKKEDQVINNDEELIPAKKDVKKQEIRLSFMPNPTSNYVTFNGAADESYTYELIDMQGKLLRSGRIAHAEQINLEEYTSGVYLIRLSSHDGSFLGSTRIIRK